MNVLVAMSGGVDSSVAAYLLIKKGWQVKGLTMSFNNDSSEQTIADAKKVCSKLNIDHIVYDCSQKLEDYVVSNFIKEYFSGRTPNPCILCNKYLKFGIMLKYVLDNGYSHLATGHYAKVIKNNNKVKLYAARDKLKDQTYFMYRVFPGLFRHVIFPLSNLKKREVKKIAKEHDLLIQKRESYSACFLPDHSLQKFWESRNVEITSGIIENLHGDMIGSHKGAVYYTVGQRSGLNIKKSVPLYVLATDIKNNKVIVGNREDLRAYFVLGHSFVFWRQPENVKNLSAKIRHSHQRQKCSLFIKGDKIIVKFNKFVETVSPGQSIVFYDKECLIGGAIISGVIKRAEN